MLGQGSGVEVWGTICIVMMIVIITLVWWHTRTQPSGSRTAPLLFGLCIASVSIAGYAFLGTPNYSDKAAVVVNPIDDLAGLSADEINQQRIKAIQDKIVLDKQNGELWYALGNAYMYVNLFEEASIAFDYSRRLTPDPQANIYSALATAHYYENGQRLTPEIQNLLDRALMLDTDNFPALTLLGSEYFMSARYQKAIDTWVQILDSEHPDADRVALITAINRAKKMM
ncbi:TPR domain-containing protein [Photobacterium kagoshimensis]|uniref:TPR domain-containing protein n=1 Tax=Photobacterium kagoshimensis TaxID=2910242 RepID=UPI003D0B7354